jgi:hypothetical protein
MADTNRYRLAMRTLEETTKKITKCLGEKLSYIAANLDNISPWGLQLLYRAYLIYIRLSRENKNLDLVEAMKNLKQVLMVMDARWHSAGMVSPIPSRLMVHKRHRGISSNNRGSRSNGHSLKRGC